MHASPGLPLLERWLRRACPAIHAARIAVVVRVVEALVLGGKLTLTHLGRNLRSAAYAKHGIKRVDRLLGNRHLRAERLTIYQALARRLLAATPRPIVLVDWADCTPGHDWLMLRAAVPLGGRAVPIYEEVHPLGRYNSPRAHRHFLEPLRAVVPATCSPILITDAGFRGPWFREVERYGWDWIGRVRNKIKYQLDGAAWAYTTALYPQATPAPRHLGSALLSHRQPYRCRLYLVRQYRRGRGRPRPAAQGARAELDRAPVPEAAQGPVAARDLTAPRPRRTAARHQALRAPDVGLGGYPRHQERALGLRPPLRPQPPRRPPGALAAHRGPRYADVLAHGTGGRSAPLDAALPSEYRAHAGRAVTRLPRPAAADQHTLSVASARPAARLASASVARRPGRDRSMIRGDPSDSGVSRTTTDRQKGSANGGEYAGKTEFCCCGAAAVDVPARAGAV